MPGIIPATRFEPSPDMDVRFPPRPTTIVEVSRLLAGPVSGHDSRQLVDIVNREPVIAASVLRRINSAMYGMRRVISDIPKAVFLLGFMEVSNIVMATALLKLAEILSTQEQRDVFNEITRTSVFSAFYTQELTRLANPSRADIAFTTGLLHAIGRLILLYNRPNDYEALWYSSESGTAPSIEAERLIFGTDHARLGALAVEAWSLPAPIGAVISNYHSPSVLEDTGQRLLAHVVALAAWTAETERTGEPATDANPDLLIGFANTAGIASTRAIELIEATRARIPDLSDDFFQD